MEYGGGGVEERRGHTKMGIASVVIAILATVLIVIFIFVAGSVGASAFGGENPQTLDPESLQDSPAFTSLIVVGFGIIGSGLLYVLGFGLGMAGIFQRRRKRLFGILGAVLNGLVLLVVILLFVLGLVVGAAGGA